MNNDKPVTPEQKFERQLSDIVNKAAANGAHPAVLHMVLHGVANEILNSVKRRAEPQPGEPTNVEPLPKPDSAN